MLNNAYKFVYQDDQNKFYTIRVGDDAYVATESVLVMDDGSELQQGLKVLKLNPALLLSMVAFASSPIEKKDPDGLQDLYGTISVDKLAERLEGFKTEALAANIDPDTLNYYTTVSDPDIYDELGVSDVLLAENTPLLFYTMDKFDRIRAYHLGINPYGTFVLFIVDYVDVSQDEEETQYNVYNVDRYVYDIATVQAIVADVLNKDETADQPKEDLQ